MDNRYMHEGFAVRVTADGSDPKDGMQLMRGTENTELLTKRMLGAGRGSTGKATLHQGALDLMGIRPKQIEQRSVDGTHGIAEVWS